MGSHMSKKTAESPTEMNKLNCLPEFASYEAACKDDADLQSFDKTLHTQTKHVINSLAEGVELRSLSFNSLKDFTGFLLEMNQQVVKVILECKDDIWKNKELFELVEEYFDNSLHTLEFCAALEKCLHKVKDGQLLIMLALQQFEGEDGVGESKYLKTLEVLKDFKAAADPFTEDFFQIFQSVYKHQFSMLERLQLRKSKLDRKLKYLKSWRKVCSIMFAAIFATVLICSVVAAAVAAPPVAATLAAATSIPVESMGKWIDSLWKHYEEALKAQKEVVNNMQAGTYVAIKNLDNIRVLIDRLVIEIESLMLTAEFAISEDAVKLGIEEIKNNLAMFTKNIEELGLQADMCSRDITSARTLVLQRIINLPS